RSKKQLKALGEEFAQKVQSWRSTNDALRAQLEQLKAHWVQAQDHWEALRKEKAEEVSRLRQSATEWEVRIKEEGQALQSASLFPADG
ncbi:MAG: hypothetical protein MUC60_03745, partial [Oscillatoria sp. Prado101]|nr:hypothetical protein [Oscillatoria sp. Prado101]